MRLRLNTSVAVVAAVTAVTMIVSSSNTSPALAVTETNSVEFETIDAQLGENVIPGSPEEVNPETTVGLEALSDNEAGTTNIEATVDADTAVVSVEAEELEAEVEVALEEAAPLDEMFDAISVNAVVDGEEVSGELIVEDFVYLGDEEFSAQVTDVETGETITVSSAEVNAQAFPVLLVLGILARIGIKAAIKQIGKTQIKKAAKSYLLNSVKANKWKHIMATKHKWGKVGAKSKNQVAEIMSKAVANGKHSPYKKGSMKAVYKYKHNGKKYTVVVTYAKNGGKISNGWVK